MFKELQNMDTLVICIILFLIVIMFLMKNESFNNDLIKTPDGWVVRDLPDKQVSINKFKLLDSKIKTLINKLVEEYPNDPRVIKLKDRYNPKILSELPGGSNNTSYSVNKGERLVICLRNKKDNGFINDNTIFFVVLHELAHIMTNSIGHKEEFWNNFKFLLKKSIEFKLYKYQDFKKSPEPYCGISITDTPYVI